MGAETQTTFGINVNARGAKNVTALAAAVGTLGTALVDFERQVSPAKLGEIGVGLDALNKALTPARAQNMRDASAAIVSLTHSAGQLQRLNLTQVGSSFQAMGEGIRMAGRWAPKLAESLVKLDVELEAKKRILPGISAEFGVFATRLEAAATAAAALRTATRGGFAGPRVGNVGMTRSGGRGAAWGSPPPYVTNPAVTPYAAMGASIRAWDAARKANLMPTGPVQGPQPFIPSPAGIGPLASGANYARLLRSQASLLRSQLTGPGAVRAQLGQMGISGFNVSSLGALHRMNMTYWAGMFSGSAKAKAGVAALNTQIIDLSTSLKAAHDRFRGLGEAGMALKGAGMSLLMPAAAAAGGGFLAAQAAGTFRLRQRAIGALSTNPGDVPGKQFVEELRAFDRENPVATFNDTITAANKALGAGFSQQELLNKKNTGLFTALGDVLALSGGNMENWNAAMQQFFEAKAGGPEGKVTMIHLRALQNLGGLPIGRILSEGLGEKRWAEAMHGKPLTSAELIQGFIKGAESKNLPYAGGMALVMKELPGQLSNLSSAFQQLAIVVGEVVLPPVTKGVEYLTKFADVFRASFDWFIVGPIIKNLTKFGWILGAMALPFAGVLIGLGHLADAIAALGIFSEFSAKSVGKSAAAQAASGAAATTGAVGGAAAAGTTAGEVAGGAAAGAAVKGFWPMLWKTSGGAATMKWMAGLLGKTPLVGRLGLGRLATGAAEMGGMTALGAIAGPILRAYGGGWLAYRGAQAVGLLDRSQSYGARLNRGYYHGLEALKSGFSGRGFHFQGDYERWEAQQGKSDTARGWMAKRAALADVAGIEKDAAKYRIPEEGEAGAALDQSTAAGRAAAGGGGFAAMMQGGTGGSDVKAMVERQHALQEQIWKTTDKEEKKRLTEEKARLGWRIQKQREQNSDADKAENEQEKEEKEGRREEAALQAAQLREQVDAVKEQSRARVEALKERGQESYRRQQLAISNSGATATMRRTAQADLSTRYLRWQHGLNDWLREQNSKAADALKGGLLDIKAVADPAKAGFYHQLAGVARSGGDVMGAARTALGVTGSEASLMAGGLPFEMKQPTVSDATQRRAQEIMRRARADAAKQHPGATRNQALDFWQNMAANWRQMKRESDAELKAAQTAFDAAKSPSLSTWLYNFVRSGRLTRATSKSAAVGGGVGAVGAFLAPEAILPILGYLGGKKSIEKYGQLSVTGKERGAATAPLIAALERNRGIRQGLQSAEHLADVAVQTVSGHAHHLVSGAAILQDAQIRANKIMLSAARHIEQQRSSPTFRLGQMVGAAMNYAQNWRLQQAGTDAATGSIGYGGGHGAENINRAPAGFFGSGGSGVGYASFGALGMEQWQAELNGERGGTAKGVTGSDDGLIAMLGIGAKRSAGNLPNGIAMLPNLSNHLGDVTNSSTSLTQAIINLDGTISQALLSAGNAGGRLGAGRATLPDSFLFKDPRDWTREEDAQGRARWGEWKKGPASRALIGEEIARMAEANKFYKEHGVVLPPYKEGPIMAPPQPIAQRLGIDRAAEDVMRNSMNNMDAMGRVTVRPGVRVGEGRLGKLRVQVLPSEAEYDMDAGDFARGR